VARTEWTGKYIAGFLPTRARTIGVHDYDFAAKWGLTAQYNENPKLFSFALYDDRKQMYQFLSIQDWPQGAKDEYAATWTKEIIRKEGLLEKIAHIVAYIFMFIAFVIMMMGLWPLLVNMFVAVLPFIWSVIKVVLRATYKVGEFVFTGIKGVVNWLVDAYQNVVKPLLTKLDNAVSAIVDKFNWFYGTAIGSIVDVYSKLFGWVDTLRTTVNGLLDNVGSIAEILGLDPDGKIRKLSQDFNDLLNSLFVDWFDAILITIDDVTSPIRKTFNELGAAVTNIVSTIKVTLGPSEKLTRQQLGMSHAAEEETGNVVIAAEEEHPEEEPEDIREVYEPEKPVGVAEGKFDTVINKFCGWLYGKADEYYPMIDKVIDDTIEEIVKGDWNLLYVYDQDIADLDEGSFGNLFLTWMMGDLTFGEVMSGHWGEALFGIKQWRTRAEANAYFEEIYERMREVGYSEKQIDRRRKRDQKLIDRKLERRETIPSAEPPENPPMPGVGAL